MSRNLGVRMVKKRDLDQENGVQVVGGSNPLTPISVSGSFANILLTTDLVLCTARAFWLLLILNLILYASVNQLPSCLSIAKASS